MCGRGACVAGGCAWWGVAGGVHGKGVCMAGGMHGRGACVAGGAYMAGGVPCMPPGRYYGYGIRSMSWRYASYWNALLSLIRLRIRT